MSASTAARPVRHLPFDGEAEADHGHPVLGVPERWIPDYVDGQYHYTATPEYFAESAVRSPIWRAHHRRLLRHDAGAYRRGGEGAADGYVPSSGHAGAAG